MNHFADGDIVECIQSHPQYVYVPGNKYTVRQTPGNSWTHVPDPAGNSGLTCDGPWALQHFRLYASAKVMSGASSPCPPPPRLPQYGDLVRILAVDGTCLPAYAVGDRAVVVAFAPMPGTIGRPWVMVEWADMYGSVIQATLRDDQYEFPILAFSTGVGVGAGLLGGLNAAPSYGAQAAQQSQAAALSSAGIKLPPDYVAVWKIPKTPKCECGAESCGEPGHSFWCDKYVG